MALASGNLERIAACISTVVVRGPDEDGQLLFHPPPETPEYQRYMEALLKNWLAGSITVNGEAGLVVQGGGIDSGGAISGGSQLPTPADTPQSRGVPARTLSPEQAGDGGTLSGACLGDDLDLEGLKLADNDDDNDHNPHHHHPKPTKRLPSPQARPRGIITLRRTFGGGGVVPRMQKNGRGRRRTDAELTMYHAIRWLGMGDVVPNVSVVTGEMLVRVPMPCTFGEGPSRRVAVGKGGEDFAVGLSRGLARDVERMRAGRVGMGKVGAGA